VLLAGGELVAALITATPAHIPRSLAAQPRRAGFAATVATEETSVAPPAGRPVVAAITDLHAAGAESATRRQPRCLPSCGPRVTEQWQYGTTSASWEVGGEGLVWVIEGVRVTCRPPRVDGWDGGEI
jgi:hypothetical protein